MNLTPEAKKALEEYLDSQNCDKSGLIHVCQAMQTEKGKSWVMDKIGIIIKNNPTFSIDNALGQLEMELNESQN